MAVRRLILALLLATVPVAARAQRAVDPGGVATRLVTLAPPQGSAPDSVTYRVDMADGFRLFARPSGSAAVLADLIRLPLTFGVSPTAPAGEVEAGRVVATWSGGAESVHPFTVQVLPRHELRFWIGRDAVTGTPGGTLELGYRLGNRGNAVDTVEIQLQAPDGWTRAALPARVVLVPGDTAVGTIQLVASEDAQPGAERVVGIVARGREAREARSVRVIVVGETRWFGDLASLPSTVFLGSTTGTDGVGGVSVQAAGEIRPGTRMTLDFRHSDQPFAAPAFRRALTGPRFRLALVNPAWRLAAGDVFTRRDLFTGPSAHGTGLDARWDGESRGVALFVAAPANGLGHEEGHLARATGYLRTGVGRFTAVVSDLRRDADIFEGFGMRSAGLRYDAVRSGQRLAIQAGLMEVTADSSGSRLGPALEAEYVLQHDRGSLTARLRTVPATVPRTAAYGDELVVSGTAGLLPGLSALGWGFLTSSPLLGADEPAGSTGLAGGLRYIVAGSGTQLQLTGHLRDTEVPDLASASTRRTLRATVDAPAGPVFLEIDGEWGRAETVLNAVRTEGPFRSFRGGLRWSRTSEWAWLGLYHRDPGTGTALTSAELAGAVRLGPAEIQGGLSAQLDAPPAQGVSLWTGTTIDVTREIAATIGVDYSPTGIGDRWRLSLGLTRSFALPLPVRREPAAHGIVYEDRNGNRVRDAGEPVLPDVTVRLGALATTTDQDGAFRFMDPVRGPLRLETAELPLGLMVPADVYLPSAGYVEIPVVRTAALELILFLDRDDDGEWDDTEDPADGVVVSIIAADGRTRDIATDSEGRARASALSPGDYTLRIHPPATRRTGGPALERKLTVTPGGTVRQTIPVPLRRREIRLPDGARLQMQQGRPNSTRDAP